MNYGFKMLRNSEPLASREVAIAMLDNFQYHKIGQPLAVRYMDGDSIEVLYAIGVRDYNGMNDTAQASFGREFYKIINKESSIIYWKTFEENQLANSTIEFAVAELTQEDFDAICQTINDEVVSFVRDLQRDVTSIYKGDMIYATTNLAHMKLPDEITINNHVYKGTFTQILESMMNNATMDWTILCHEQETMN